MDPSDFALAFRLVQFQWVSPGSGHDAHIFRRIPDKFEQAIILGLLINHDGLLIDLASYADDVATHDRRRITCRHALRISTCTACVGSLRAACPCQSLAVPAPGVPARRSSARCGDCPPAGAPGCVPNPPGEVPAAPAVHRQRASGYRPGWGLRLPMSCPAGPT